MRHQSALRLVLAAWFCCSALVGDTGGPPPTAAGLAPELANRMAAARVPFIENEGHLPHSEVRFYARTFAGTMFVTDRNDLVYSLPQRTGGRTRATLAFRESFAGAMTTQPRGESPSTVRVSHFKGPNPSHWRSQLATFDAVELGELYPEIRVQLRAAGDSVEKLFFVGPGGNVDQIDLAIQGVDAVAISSDKQLVLETTAGQIVFSAPLAYQVVDGSRRPVEVAYRLGDDHHYGFRVGAYDRGRELVIDPVLASTYLGGHNPSPPGNYDDDIIWGMATAHGDVFVGGATQSPDFPTQLGYDDTLGSNYPDGFVTRLSADLTTLIASTYIGTDGFDRVTDLAIDEAGTVVLVGQAGWGFPVTEGAYNWQGSVPVGGGFVLRLSADLSQLLASAVPTPVDYPRTMALGNGGVYFGGSTNYTDFPITPGAYLSTCCPAGSFGIREYDGFAGKLSLDLSTLEAMTYLGGNTVSAIAVTPDSSVFVTDGFDYAVTGSIARFDAGLTTRPAYLSYYPGSQSGSTRTYFNDVAPADGYVVAVGQTYMNDLPATAGAFDTLCGNDGDCDALGSPPVPRSDGFIAIYSYDLGDPLALTYLGGSHHESIRAVALDAGGGIYISGETTSMDLPTAGTNVDTECGLDGTCDASGMGTPIPDGFVARLSADLSDLDFATYLGGSGEDWPTVVDVDDIGLLRAAGFTDSADFPTTDEAFDPTYNGGTSDAFVSLFDTQHGVASMVFADGFELGDMSTWSMSEP